MKDEDYWFHAKTYGYGWGLPANWKGWLVFIGCIAAVAYGIVADNNPYIEVGLVAAGLITFIVACYWKGERIKGWQWGGEKTTDDQALRRRLVPVQIIHLFLGPLILALGLIILINPPAEINATIGYRTELARSSQEVWDEAQYAGAIAMILTGIIVTIIQLIAIVSLPPTVSILISILFLIAFLGLSIIGTESYLFLYIQR